MLLLLSWIEWSNEEVVIRKFFCNKISKTKANAHYLFVFHFPATTTHQEGGTQGKTTLLCWVIILAISFCAATHSQKKEWQVSRFARFFPLIDISLSFCSCQCGKKKVECGWWHSLWDWWGGEITKMFVTFSDEICNLLWSFIWRHFCFLSNYGL